MGEGPCSLKDLAGSVNIPRRYVVDISYELEKSKLITRVDGDDVAYQPSFDINKMDIYTVLDKYESEGMGDFDPRKSKAFQNIEEALEEIKRKWRDEDTNVLIKDL